MTNKPEVPPLHSIYTLSSLPIYMEEMDRKTRQIHLWTGRQEHTDGQADKTDTLTDRQTRQIH